MNDSTLGDFPRNFSSSHHFQNEGFSNAAGILYLSVMVICGSIWVLYFKCYKKRFVTKTKGIEWETSYTCPREKEYEDNSYFKIVPNNAESEISIIDSSCKKGNNREPDFTMPGLIADADTPELEDKTFSSAPFEHSDSDVTPKYFDIEELSVGHYYNVNGEDKY